MAFPLHIAKSGLQINSIFHGANDSTVVGGQLSAEAVAATELGLTVDVIDSVTWLSFTPSGFAQYDCNRH